ncbi:MAG TPA: DinB family protein [Gemmatimonadaceae bacterium]|nr:DinB family protein [Gemmatimonadaceae bacterium]
MLDLISGLKQTREETLNYFALSDDALERSYAPGKWSVRYLLHHLADSETVLYYRIRRVLSEPNQVIWVYDQDAWARALDYATVPLEISRRVYDATREAVIYTARHYPGSEKIPFVHSQTGLRTLADEFEKVVTHNRHHLDQIAQALSAT